MSANKVSKVLLCLAPILMTSCLQVKKEEAKPIAAVKDDAVAVNAISTAVADVQNKVGAISDLTPGNASVASLFFKKNLNFLMANAYAALPEEFGDDWEINTPFQDPAYCGADCSPVYPSADYYDRSIKYWVQAHLDKDAKRGNGSSINIFDRIDNNLNMLCVLGQLIPGSGTYPKNGSYDFIITKGRLTAISKICHMDISNPDQLIGKKMQVIASDAATTTFYDKKFVLNFEGDINPQTLLIRNNGSVINVATSESGSHGQTRSLISYDVIHSKLYFEYISASAGSGDNAMYVYRIFHDENADTGHVLVLEGGGNFAYADTRFTLTGKPKAGGTIALSMSRSQGFSFNGKRACIRLSDGAIVQDGVLNCTVNGKDIEDAGISALLGDAIAKRNDTDWASLNTNIGIPFTDEIDMYSANVTK